jgi:hypothetical protein
MGVSVHAVRFWIKRGLLPNAYEVAESRGSVWMIPEGDLKGFEPPKKTGRPPKPTGTQKRATAKASNGTSGKSRKGGGKR